MSQKYQCFFLDVQGRILARQEFIAGDLPLKFHPVAIRASAVDTPFGAD
jgi:hypothetical protein